MDSGIIISLILGGTSIISSTLFGLIPGMRKQKIERLEDKVGKLVKDVDSLCRIETLLIEEIFTRTGKNRETIKKDIRKQVREEKGYPLSEYTKPSNIARELTNIK